MGKHSGRKTKRKKKVKTPKPSLQITQLSNFVSEAGPGCYIARRFEATTPRKSPEWMIGWEDIDPEDFGIDEEDSQSDAVEIPDIALDPEECTVSVCNVDDCTKVAYVTIFATRVVGAHGKELPQGSSTDNDGTSLSCVTFIVLCPPMCFAHLCYLDVSSAEELSDVRIESDVSKWRQHPDPSDEHPYRIGFPLNDNQTSFLCTQGEDGELTHFFSGNLHAIDFRCPVGTELLAVADGTVLESKDENTLSGIAVTNLFHWNSILLQVEDENNPTTADGPLLVEYVHISKSLVKAGERVVKGQVIGYSGSVGFSPEPHLHFSAFRSSDPEAPTVRVRFDTLDGETFLPRAGYRYNASGMVSNSVD